MSKLSRRLLGLGLTMALFVGCMMVTVDSQTLAQGAKPKTVTLTRSLKDLKAAQSDLKSLKGEYGGHRAKAIKHLESAIDEVEKAIKAAKGKK